MWILPLPDNSNAMDDLKVALTYKNGEEKYSLSNEALENIRVCYNKYEESQGKASQELRDITTLPPDDLQAIHDAYSEVQDNSRLSSLRDSLLLSADRCPCCGIGAADELDHHLPRSVYKFLAVYSSNLVPMCHKCNNKKRTVAGLTPEDSFIHIYYDRVPQTERFLFAKTIIAEGKLSVEFEVEKIPSLNSDLYSMLDFQITRVGFNKRVLREINTFLGAFLVSLDMIYDVSKCSRSVSEFLLRNENSFNKRWGMNDWRSSLLSSLALNNDFCDGGYKLVLGAR